MFHNFMSAICRSYKRGFFYSISNHLEDAEFKFSLISEGMRTFYYSKNIFHNFWSNIYFHFKNINRQFL